MSVACSDIPPLREQCASMERPCCISIAGPEAVARTIITIRDHRLRSGRGSIKPVGLCGSGRGKMQPRMASRPPRGCGMSAKPIPAQPRAWLPAPQEIILVALDQSPKSSYFFKPHT